MRQVNDSSFLEMMVDGLAGLPGVRAVALGGSRGRGTERVDSDWDFALYYRDRFDPQSLRDIGWPGEVFELGAWGGGVFNGGAWLTIDGRRVDVHYRDLGVVLHELAEAEAGRFRIESLLFNLAGIPSYLVVGELALGRVLYGSLPAPNFPPALRRRAPEVWWTSADLVFDYARSQHARHGRAAACTGLLVQAALQSAHAVLAAGGEWVTNEKALLTRAGLDGVDPIVLGLGPSPVELAAAVEQTRALCADALRSATRGRLPEENGRP